MTIRSIIFAASAAVCMVSGCLAFAGGVPRIGLLSGFQTVDVPGKHIDILFEGKQVGRWMYEFDDSTPQRRDETYKPYLHVFDADGNLPITKGVGGLYTHHRGIFVGWMKITVGDKTYDRWHMIGGNQIQRGFRVKSGSRDASIVSNIDWTGSTSAPIIQEQRTMTFHAPPDGAYVEVDVTSKLKAVEGETTLGGDPEHAGLQFRPANEVDPKATQFLYPQENADAHKDLDYAWTAASYVLHGKPFSVVYLNHPANPKWTLFSAYRDYGRFGAFFKTTIPSQATLELKTRLLVMNGAMPSVEWIQSESNRFTGKRASVPKTTLKHAEISK